MRRLLLVLVATALLLAGCGGSGHVTKPHFWLTPSHTHRLTACISTDCGPWSVTLNWVIPPYPSTTGYNLFLNGTQIGTATSSPYVFSGSDCGVTNTLGVQAHSASGTGPIWSTPYTAPACGGGGGPTVNYFVAQSAAGSGNGSSCSNAEAVSTLGTGTQWTAGNVIGLCGTITSAITAEGSGSSGNPVTVYWEPGATMSSADWGAGDAFNISGRSYITLNGGTNGSIQATAEGTGLADQGVASIGVYATTCTGCTVENLTIKNLYVHTSTSDSTVDQTEDNAIKFSGSNDTFTDNTIHDVGWAIVYFSNPSDSNDTISDNEIYNADHSIALEANAAGGNLGPFFIYGNHMHDWANWDVSSSDYHHDAIHCFTGGGTAAHWNAVYDFDNRFDGAPGSGLMNSTLFMEGPGAGTPCGDSTSKFYVFNNVVDITAPLDNGYLALFSGSPQVFNDTLIGSTTTSPTIDCTDADDGGSVPTSMVFENNVSTTCNFLITAEVGTFASGSPDYNLWANGGSNSFSASGGAGGCTFLAFSQFSTWKTCITNGGAALESHSSAVASADLNSDGSLQGGSPAIGAGANLTSTCAGLPTTPVNVLSACETTYTGPPVGGTAGSTTTGSARPSSGAWNAGAF